MVQSKSELTLATYFASPDVNLGDYTYNRRLEGDGYPYISWMIGGFRRHCEGALVAALLRFGGQRSRPDVLAGE